MSHTVLLSIVRHFQHLFDVPTMSGIYPRMNELYLRYNEMRNVQKTLAGLLDLGIHMKLNEAMRHMLESWFENHTDLLHLET